MQVQNQTSPERYSLTFQSARSNVKMLQTASTGLASTKNSRFRMRKSNSFTNTNIKNKLDAFAAVLETLQGQLVVLRGDTKESLQYCQSITQELPSNLSTKYAELKQRIKQMVEDMEIIKKQERNRIMAIRKKCSELYDKNVEIKDRFNGIRFRLEEMERIMGYYGGFEKYRS